MSQAKNEMLQLLVTLGEIQTSLDKLAINMKGRNKLIS